MKQSQGNSSFSLAVSWRRALMQDFKPGQKLQNRISKGFLHSSFPKKLPIFRSYHSEKIMSRLSVICRYGTETCFTFSFLKGSFKNNDMFDVVIYLTNWRWFSHVSLPELIN